MISKILSKIPSWNKNAKEVLIIGAVILAVVLVAFVIWNPFGALEPSNTQSTKFVVPKGQAISVIGQRLSEQKLIKSPLAFRITVSLNDLEKKVQAGSYQISPAMTVKEIALNLTQGSDDIWITLLEGWRREEIAGHLETKELEFFDRDEFLELTSNKEGTLYPDTYLIPKEYTTAQIIDLLEATFDQKIKTSPEIQASLDRSNRSFEEVLIMASLVEREARGFDQMKKVAGILWNRIDLGMALQVDATLQYIEGYSQAEQSWWTPPLISTKQSSSRYNTYFYPGLPPGPIANPSLDAVAATLLPAESDNLYYLHSPDGRLYFSQTLEQHNANIERYLR